MTSDMNNGGSELPAPPLLPFVDGTFVEPRTDEVLPVVDPSTNKIVAQVRAAGVDEVDRAAAAARRAFDDGPWPRMPVFERGQVLRAIADAITANAEAFARVEAINGGKPILAARREVAGAARVFNYYAGAMDKFFGETIPLSPDLLDFTLREPIGVAAQIVPWNFPLLAAAWKLGPALATGCTSLLKPSPATPLSALMLADLCRAAGVPAGVVNVLPGGAEVGHALAAHAGVDAISFTGSTSVGAAIMRTGADSIKRVALELGGKSATIVFADADLDKAARSAVGAAFGNAGQSCSARSRLIVQRAVLEPFQEAFVAASRGLRIGRPLDETTGLGPLISDAHWHRVHHFVEGGVAAGAKLLGGGGRPADLSESGNYYAPTILGGVTADMAVAREEIFGPVCSVMAFDSEDEAIRLSNDSRYGLNGSVWSRDIGCALRVVRRLRTGMIAVNGLPSASLFGVFAPFGGYKQSGIGRELGMHALSFYTEIKNVVIDLSA